MKKAICSFILTLVALFGYAEDHLSFKGIPIEGSLNSFCQKLKDIGFKKISDDRNIVLFNGEFTGRDATIGVVATDDCKDVYKVMVIFDPNSEWKNLVALYEYYKNLYTIKYGNPFSSVENNPAHSDSNFVLMFELRNGTVEYESIWNVNGGLILLNISKIGDVEGAVMISYIDNQNYDSMLQKDLDDI